MHASANDTYLETEIMTAAPQKLQLMLIEAAIRNADRAIEALRQDDHESAGESLIRAQRIVSELICGLDASHDSELVRRMASIYVYLFQTFIDAHVNSDEAKIQDALRVLNEERETWRQVCEKLGDRRQAGEDDSQQLGASFEA
jgi:flagellar protein FliS